MSLRIGAALPRYTSLNAFTSCANPITPVDAAVVVDGGVIVVEVEARRASERVVSSRSMAVDNCVALRPPLPPAPLVLALGLPLPSSLVLVVVLVLSVVVVAMRY